MNLPRSSPLRSPALTGLAAVLILSAGCKKAVRHVAPPPSSTSAKTATAPAAASPETASLYHSYFNDAPPPGNFGRDPFFPNSTRRNPPDIKPKPTPGAPSTAPHVEPILKLGAVVGSAGKRLAVLNSSYILTEGESADVRTPNGKVHVKILKIDENSVDLQVEGESGQTHLELSQPKSP